MPPDVVRFDTFEFDMRRGTLRRHGRAVRLQPKPALLLAALVRRAGHVVTRDQLRAELWLTDTNVEFEAGFNTAMRKVRRALGDSAAGSKYIRTIPGYGYTFVGAIVTARPPAPEALPRTGLSRAAALIAVIVGTLAVLESGHLPLGIADASVRRGMRLMLADPPQVPAALAAFEVAAAVVPGHSRAWAWLSLAHARMAYASGEAHHASYAVARAAAQRTMLLDSRSWPAYAASAYIRAGQQRDYPGAAAAFERAVAAGAYDRRVLIDFMGVLKELRQFDRALAIVDHGLRLSPHSAALYAHRGLLLHALGRYEQEVPALMHAVALNPRSAEAHFHLGLGYARRSQYVESVASLRTAVALSDEAPLFLSWLGRIAADAGDRAAAEDVLQKLRSRARTTRVPADLIDSVAFHLASSLS